MMIQPSQVLMTGECQTGGQTELTALPSGDSVDGGALIPFLKSPQLLF